MRALPYLWYPLFVGLATACFFALLANDVSPLWAAYVPAAGVGCAVLLLEAHFRERDSWRPTRPDVLSDLAFMSTVMIALPRALVACGAIVLADHLHESHRTGWWPHEWPLWVQMLTMVLLVDLMRYWLHRACHEIGPLWRLHQVHHSPDILYVLNVGRFHPLEKILHFALDTVPFLLLGVAPEVIAGYVLLYSVNGLFQHSNVKLRYGWLNYVVASAETHRWHHARDPSLASCNYSNTTIVWDLIFGTWCYPGQVGEIGILDRHYPKGFLAQLRAPFVSEKKSRLKKSWGDRITAARLYLAGVLARCRLARHAKDPMRVQSKLLRRILRANGATSFGREHGFDRLDSYESFAASVPVREFEGLRPYIEAEIARGERSLTMERPLRYVRTSGTTNAPKDIPLVSSHLAALKRVHRDSVAFQYDVCPEAFDGSIFVMVSPPFEGLLANGKPYGSASGIVAGDTSRRIQNKFVAPPIVHTIDEPRLKYLLALRLALARDDVSYLGAANPTTLLTLIELYRAHQEELIADVRCGTFFLSDHVPAEVLRAVQPLIFANERRADELERGLLTGSARFADLWPKLRMVVTWTCASAGIALDMLRSELPPQARIMELGYISSEFRGTITIGKRSGSGLPTLDTHFFEFVEREVWEAGGRTTLTLDRVRKGREYYLIVTTPSGLYRYFINDIVKVTGFFHSTPLLKFVQKGKGITNITGEKVAEGQVLAATREALRDMNRTARFVMMLADEVDRRYRLYVELDDGRLIDTRSLAQVVDDRLRRLNIEYDAKRESGRLALIEARVLEPGTGERYKADCVKRGQREGQFKMVALAYRRTFSFDLDAQCEEG